MKPALLAAALLAPPLAAQVCGPIQTLQPDELPFFNSFGTSVALESGLAAIGSDRDGAAGFEAGAIYLMDVASAAPLLRILPVDGASQDRLGTAVALWNGVVLGGAPGDDDVGLDTGSVLLADAATGALLDRLRPTPAWSKTGFGTSLSVHGDRLLVGAPTDGPLGGKTGAAYLFDLATGQQLLRLVADHAAAGDRFGISVGLHGDLALVGADWRDGSNGAAYLFDLNTGSQLTRFVPQPSQIPAQFGGAVALSADRALIGAEWGGADGLHGTASLFDLETLQLVRQLESPEPLNFDGFGVSVALEGATAAVGKDDNGSEALGLGGAYLFDAGSGDLLVRLQPENPSLFERFGGDLDFDGPELIVGRYLASGFYPVDVFSGLTSAWSDLGQGLSAPSSAEPATLNGCGLLGAGGIVQLELTGAPPGLATVLVIGASQLDLPLGGGVLVPAPDLLLAGLVTDGLGALELTLPIAPAVPVGLERFAQAWSIDGSGSSSASNAVRVTTL